MAKNMTRLSTIVLISAALAGCEPDDSAQVAALKAENKALVTQLDAQWGTRQADYEYMEHVAGVAAGCDLIIPVCPPSVTEPGRAAIEEGASGGGTGVYWLIVCAKTALLAIFLSALWVGVRWGRLTLLQPKKDALERAQQLISTAEAEARESSKRNQEALASLADANAKYLETEERLADLQNLSAQLDSKIAAQHVEVASLGNARNALTAFN